MSTLVVTGRAELKGEFGANTHFSFNPSVYSVGSKPNPVIVKAIIDLGIGLVRERYWPRNRAQQAAFMELTANGVQLYLTIGTIGTSVDEVIKDIADLAKSPIAPYVIAVCGPNEPNAAGGPKWPAKLLSIQQAIYTATRSHDSLLRAAVVAPALKHHVPDYDKDLAAIGDLGIAQWCDEANFHFYPGGTGPIANAAERERIRPAYGDLSAWQSETGWTEADVPRTNSGQFSVEALLRNHLSGMAGTLLYEFADEAPYVKGREGLFGLMTASEPKPAYTAIQKLLATPDGGEMFAGWLAHPRGVVTDVTYIVTSEGSGQWTLYLFKALGDDADATVDLVMPGGKFSTDIGVTSVGTRGNDHSTVEMSDTMMVVKVSALA